MAHKTTNRRKFSLLTSTALTKQVAALGALGVVFGANSAFALDPNALPQDPNVVGGGATFNSSGATLTVNQSTNRTVIDWRSFDIGSNATTNFVQPGASAIAVNRVNASANPTQIQGHLNANGQVWILNPNGVLFGKTAKIDVAGIIASTGNIDTAAFMRGDNRLQFTGGDGGTVDNAGLISVADGGLAAFVAPSVRNSGIIRARVGKVTLAAGTTFTLDLAGDQLVELGLGANNAIVDQSGQVLADGSVVNITAKAASAVVDSVINISGTVLASSVSEDGGTITLSADNITTASSAALKADAGANGDGGTIYAYADKLGKYDGTFSAKGGSASGDGGFVETSGKKVQIADGISVNTLAANGKTGDWTIDPDDLVIGGVGADIATSTVVDAMNNTGMTLTANNSITVNDKIDSSAQTNANTLALNDENTDNNLTINLNDKITLGSHQHLTGQGTTVNVANTGLIQNGVDVAMTGGATVNVAAGDYNQTVTVRKDGVTLAGADGAKIIVPSVNETNAVDVWANDFTITGFEIAGPAANESYLTYNWGSINTRGVVIHNGALNFTIADNNIHGLRNNILIDGRNTGYVTNNVIDNSKSGISVQYTDAGAGNSEGYVVDISGNSEGVYGNEWGLNTHLNGHYVGATYYSNSQKIAADATTTVQQALLANSAANGGWSVQDQGYSNSNRTRVVVSTTGSDTNQGSALGSLKTIQAGINAVVTGGTVNVNDGTYVIPAGGGAYVHITKALNLIGQSEAGTIIDASGASTYGIRVQADDVTLSDFTVMGPTSAGSYGIKVEPLAGAIIDPNNRLNDFSIANVSIKDSYKTGLDLNGVDGATIDHVTVTGATHGNGVALTDTANTTLTNVTTSGNAWGGLALYQTNNTYNQQVNNISVDASNSFGEANGVYLEDQSASKDYGSLTIAGYGYAVGNNGLSNDVYTWLQKTRQDAIDFALTPGANIAAATSFVRGWTGSATDHAFVVGYNTSRTLALSINAALNAATSGDTVNVDAGDYAGTVTIAKGVTLQGTDADNRAHLTDGILLSGAFSDLVLKDLIVSGDGGGNKVVSGGAVTNLTVDNVKVDGESVAARMGFGGGKTYGDISITNSQFVNINGWSAFDNSTGSSPTALTSVVFSGNLLDNVQGHIAFRQLNPTNVTISGNTVQNTGNATNSFGGIFKVFNSSLGGTVDFADNNVSGIGTSGFNPAGEAAYGAALLVRNVANLNITGNTFTDNNQVFAVEPGKALPTTTTFTDNTFTNNGYVIYTPTNVLAGGTINFTGTNNIVAGANTVQDIVWRGGDALDLTNVQFDGKLGSEMTLDELFATEDLITHGLDSATAGLATVKAGNVYVTTNSGSIQRGIDKATAGDTINVAAGTYGAFGTQFGGPADLTIQTVDGAVIDGSTRPSNNRIVDLRADGTTLSGFTINNGGGAGVGVSISGQNVTVSGNNISDTQTGIQTTTQYSAGNATISGNTINTAYGISLQNTGNAVSGNNVTASTEGVGLKQGANTFTGNTFNIGAGGNALALYSGASAGDMNASGNTVTIAGGNLQGAVDLTGAGGNLNVNGGTYNEDVVVNGSRNISFVGATLNKFTQNVASAIGGTVSAVNGFFLNAATTLLSDTVLNGAVTAQAIDGSTAGGQALTINGGSNAVALGNLGATTRLGATNVTGTTSLNGSVYKANALTFNGPATLTQALTTFDTSAAGGNVTFTGNIFGTADGAQSVAFTTGNGDISLQNAGTDSIWLGDMSVVGDDFSAATVYAATYVSLLTGNQTFTSTTLHTRGAVNSSVGGNANGPIVSGGDVNVTTGGDFNGNVNAPSGTISGTNITGTFTGNTFTFVASNSVDLTTNANSINVSSPSGTVDGTFSTINNSGGSIVVNGQTRTGNSETNPNQIVVEGYTLPAGAIVTSSGEIVLPNGLVIGLISPQAGGGAPGSKPKVVVVHSVQKLGELLAQGYVAIIIDLSKNNDDQEELALAD